MKKKPLIRVARPGDEAGIHEAHMRSIREVCVKDHGEEEVRGWGNRPLGDRWQVPLKEGHVWVVEDEGAIKGFAYIKIWEKENRAFIHGLYLTPEVLKLGLGKQLASLMITKAKEKGVLEITLESSLTAHAFYQSLGFKDTGPMQSSELGGSLVRDYPMKLKL